MRPRSKMGLDLSARHCLLFTTNCPSVEQQIEYRQEHYVGALGRKGIDTKVSRRCISVFFPRWPLTAATYLLWLYLASTFRPLRLYRPTYLSSPALQIYRIVAHNPFLHAEATPKTGATDLRTQCYGH